MPTESAVPAHEATSSSPSPPPDLKCTSCGVCAPVTTSMGQDVVILSDPVERICGSCVRSQGLLNGVTDVQPDDLAANDGRNSARAAAWETCNPVVSDREATSPDRGAQLESRQMRSSDPVPIPPSLQQPHTPQPHTAAHSHSLPPQNVQPWKTVSPAVQCKPDESKLEKRNTVDDTLPNPLLDIANRRTPSVGRGALHSGSIFKGTQTSGRCAYDVEVKLLDVNFPESTLSGYLSISHLTESHPHLTTFFTGEIIGPKHGFITGTRYGATEHDDMRHWGRFEQFRRPSTRADMLRPELLLRDAMPDRTRGESKGKERDFVFLRIKERFLVPDHTVRDISGASFAGFYYAMVDLAPAPPVEAPASPTIKTSVLPSSPTVPRRTSNDARNPVRPDFARRRQSSTKFVEPTPSRGEATIRGNREPFQELFLTHVPNRSSSTMELR